MGIAPVELEEKSGGGKGKLFLCCSWSVNSGSFHEEGLERNLKSLI